jgi:hypothetical protein
MEVCVKMSEVKYAPRIPRIEPMAAPISRRKLALRSRISNMMTARANSRPVREAYSLVMLKGLK